jgi:DNA-binding SARP family transcriptional activator
MQFRLLGPLEVTEQNMAALGGVMQPSLLAILLLHASEVVAADRLIVAGL